MLINLSLPVAIALLVALATVLNRVVEHVFGTAFDRVAWLKPHRWALMYIALVLGLIAAFSYDLDLLASEAFGFVPSAFGRMVTGILLSGGSNLINDLWPQPKKPGVSATASVSSGGETATASLESVEESA